MASLGEWGEESVGSCQSSPSLQRVCRNQIYSRLVLVSKRIHFGIWNTATVSCYCLKSVIKTLMWFWVGLPCVGEELAMAGGGTVSLRSKVWSPRAWWWAGLRQGISALAK